MGVGDHVAPQTDHAVTSGEDQPQRVRVLFDAGNHHSFVTARVALLAWLSVARQY